MLITNEKLKKVLLSNDIIGSDDFDRFEKQAHDTKRDIKHILIEKNYLNEEGLANLIAESIKVPFIRLLDANIPDETLNLVPEKVARERRVLAFNIKGESLEVAMIDPTDLDTINLIRKKTDLTVRPYLALERDINKALVLYKRGLGKEFTSIIESNLKKARDAGNDLTKAAADLPIVKIIDTLLEFAAVEEASDIHIEPRDHEIIIRFRIDGILHDILSLPISIHPLLVARIKVLADLKIDEHRKPQDGRFKIMFNSEPLAFRTSIIPTFYGEKAVLRLLFETVKYFTLSDLGFSGTSLERIDRAIKKPYGMILATGPTGSGKTTTLYTILNILNSEDVNIVTIEDPIEYSIERVNQTQVNDKVGLKFSTGLRSLVRQDPDIIMVGEIRDDETANIAVNSAMTGHLVLSTLHTNDAAGALPRLMDMGVEPYLVASTVNVIVAQRLVRTICKNCMESYLLSPKEIKYVKDNFDLVNTLKTAKSEGMIGNQSINKLRFYRGKGCEKCNDTGYRGRTGIREVLEIDDDLRQMIITKTDSSKIGQAAISKGMVTMLQDGFIKALSGMTTLEEILRVTKV